MKQSRQENITYLVLWGLLFAAPLLSLYVRTVNDAHVVFDWTDVFIVWRKFAVFLLLFLVHNFLLAPLLVRGHKRKVYFSIVAVIIAAFTVYQCSNRPEAPNPKTYLASPPAPLLKERGVDHPRPLPARDRGLTPLPHREGPGVGLPPPIIGEHDILAVVLLILMFGANIGIKGYYHSRDDRKRLAQLERENLEQQLEYLRYQINPHFFMNTLNNIHALVDIDPEQAKETIVELSRMMRYVLYEGNKQQVPLSREFDFIRHFVALMQLRYTEKVKITLDLPKEVPDRQLPPLILITFIENAFKHGISYQHESFVEIKAEVSHASQLLFTCRNSKAEQTHQERQRVSDGTPGFGPELSRTGMRGGIGLANVRKRLDLLYGHEYTLHINEASDAYAVELILPLTRS